MMESNKVADLINKRQKINKEIEDIQKGCPHFNKSIKYVRERLDSSTMVIRYVCNECLLPVGYPSNKEMQNYLNQ